MTEHKAISRGMKSVVQWAVWIAITVSLMGASYWLGYRYGMNDWLKPDIEQGSVSWPWERRNSGLE